MAELRTTGKPNIIAFYLPQFHEIKENNDWWGKGFTEWTNVKKAHSLFPGHDQPRIPLENKYYNLLEDDVKIWQSKLAQDYGVFGFCYYHYWFRDGKQLLEKPAEQMLKNKAIKIPFCFSWANENWSRNWDGGNREIIMEQNYGGKADWEMHFQYLLPFFRDERYITLDGKPLFVIYKPEQIIDILPMTQYFRSRAIEEGFPGLCLAFQFPTYYTDMFYREDVFDYRIEFEPVFSRNFEKMQNPGTARWVKDLRKIFGEKAISIYRRMRKSRGQGYPAPKHLSMFFYDEAWEKILDNPMEERLLPGGFVDWDNTPRNKHGVMYSGFSVQKFQNYMTRLLHKAQKYQKPAVFLNAWNEWGEGAYLEPDRSTEFQKLEAIHAAVKSLDSSF